MVLIFVTLALMLFIVCVHVGADDTDESLSIEGWEPVNLKPSIAVTIVLLILLVVLW